MKNLTLIIPTKKEVESLPIFLREIENLTCRKLIVLQEEDVMRGQLDPQKSIWSVFA